MKIRFLHDREFAYVTEDIVKHSLNMSQFPLEYSHNKKINTHINRCPAAAVHSSLDLAPAESLMPASVTRRPSVKFKTLIVLTIGSG